ELRDRDDSTSIHASDSGGECGLRGNSIRRFRRGQRAPRLYPGRRELRQRPPARWARFGSYTLKRVFADRAIVFGAQTERRGGADPVGGLLGGKSPTGHLISTSTTPLCPLHRGARRRLCAGLELLIILLQPAEDRGRFLGPAAQKVLNYPDDI